MASRSDPRIDGEATETVRNSRQTPHQARGVQERSALIARAGRFRRSVMYRRRRVRVGLNVPTRSALVGAAVSGARVLGEGVGFPGVDSLLPVKDKEGLLAFGAVGFQHGVTICQDRNSGPP